MAQELANVDEDPLSKIFKMYLGNEDTPSRELPTDILVNTDTYKVIVNVSGISKSQLKVSFSGHLLKIFVQRDEDVEGFHYLQHERANKSLFRNFYLQAPDFTKTKAKLGDGVLLITIPKQKTTSHSISIQ